jgi:hypothetical protein
MTRLPIHDAAQPRPKAVYVQAVSDRAKPKKDYRFYGKQEEEKASHVQEYPNAASESQLRQPTREGTKG